MLFANVCANAEQSAQGIDPVSAHVCGISDKWWTSLFPENF